MYSCVTRRHRYKGRVIIIIFTGRGNIIQGQERINKTGVYYALLIQGVRSLGSRPSPVHVIRPGLFAAYAQLKRARNGGGLEPRLRGTSVDSTIMI